MIEKLRNSIQDGFCPVYHAPPSCVVVARLLGKQSNWSQSWLPLMFPLLLWRRGGGGWCFHIIILTSEGMTKQWWWAFIYLLLSPVIPDLRAGGQCVWSGRSRIGLGEKPFITWRRQKKNHNDDELMQMQMTLLLFMAVLIIQIDRQQRDEHRDKCWSTICQMLTLLAVERVATSRWAMLRQKVSFSPCIRMNQFCS